ncbi:hypothetical protein FGRMN_1806 [Fusarium graminum]|nr:hypothetical protein FGRMN_1806 [Fusarium graminum]
MSSQTIRLRLVVRRHSVPEVKLIWPCVATEDLTVSKLLALVNEVVPLESGDWGLEDYVVELPDGKGDSFELLHFQPVGKVLKEDDQVLIRSLSTDDLRRRRLSGRHQISYDGKHLIDGLAFGRPWLRAPRDRPALDLPPRKRARITNEEEIDEDDDSYADEDAQSEQLLLEDSTPSEVDQSGSVRLRARFLDIDQLEEEDDSEELDDDDANFLSPGNVILEPPIDNNDDEEEDSEISDEDEPDVDLLDELRLLQEDNALVEQTPQIESQNLLSENNSQDPQALLPTQAFDVSWLDKMTALRAAFPLTSMSILSDELERNDKDLRRTYQIIAATNKPVISFDEAMERALLGPGILDSQSPDQQSLNVEEDDSPVLRLPGQPEHANAKRPLIQEVDDEPLPFDTSTGANHEAPRPLISVVEETDAETSSSSSSSGSDSGSESDMDMREGSGLDSESGSEGDSDDSDSESSDGSASPGLKPLPPRDISSSDDSDSSDSDSDSESESDSDSSKAADTLKDTAGSDSKESDSSSDSDSESEPEELSSKQRLQAKQPQAPVVPEPNADNRTVGLALKPTEEPKTPGTGMAKTKKRNARRRDLKRIRAMQRLEDTQSQPSTNDVASDEAEFLARKRALLSVVSDENEYAPNSPKDTPATETRPMIVEVEIEETPAATTSQDVAPTEDSASTQRRHKVDMGAGRRLVFGALGLKNPKSKADEDKLRDTLMKDVKPLRNPRVQTGEAELNVEPSVEPENGVGDPEAWREKISYRAVECCQEDVVLSEPPFPFVQRWDPQQQYSTRKRKRNSQSFNEESYYGEDSQWNGDEEWNDNSQKKKKKKSKKRKSKGAYDGGCDEEEAPESSLNETGLDGDEDIVLNYDDIPSKPRLEDSQFTDIDDLPSLPSDMSTLPSLEFPETKPGMVITWKQMVMSKATKWQPEMVPMTGLILSINENRDMHVLLAKRDRDENDKEYDQHTGQRIYSKFEAPDFDDDDEEEDDGRRDLSWTDMADPRLVQPAPSTNSTETLAKTTEVANENTKPVQDTDSTVDNKVSTRTNPDETMAEELDTQKVRAEVEADLEEREAVGQPSETDKSTSIPSGQHPPRLELAGSVDDSPISSFIRPVETASDSLVHQIRETSQAALIRERVSLSNDSECGINGNVEENAKVDEIDGSKDAKDLGKLLPTVEAGWDTVVPDSIPLTELSPLPTQDDIPVDRRLHVVPSSAGSVRSGRRPPSISGLEDLPEEGVEDSVGQELIDNSRKRTPSPQITNVSVRSSSPFPSLEEIFHTARQTQSPMRFTQYSMPRFIKPEKGNMEYDEAMRKLDEGEEESDRSPDRNKSLRRFFPNSTQSDVKKGSPLRRSLKSEASKTLVPEAEHAATPPKSQKVKQEARFVMQEASQVIELSSSPPSVQFTEDYAQDSEDETYQDSPLPQGDGWIQKNYSEVKTRSRGKSLPAKATTTATTSKTTSVQNRTTRGRTSLPPARDVTASAYSQIRGRRKPTRKF